MGGPTEAGRPWTLRYPELGTGPVSFEDSISPEFWELERRAIFERTWLNIGRVEEVATPGAFFTKDIPPARTSILVVRGADGDIRAFHNVCRHRGNRLVWDGAPGEETRGRARRFVCKYHGWRYDLDGACSYVHQEGQFFDIDKQTLGLVPVHCEVWAGFIFVHLAEAPEESLRHYLGTMVGALEDYPFHEKTECYAFRAENRSNWKIFLDAFQEYYHVPPLHTQQLGPGRLQNPEAAFEGAHYQIDGPHRMVSSSSPPKHRMADRFLYPTEVLCRSSNLGPFDVPESDRRSPGVNPGKVDDWAIDNFQIFPNLELLIYERGWYLAYRFWPTSHETHVFEGYLFFPPSRSVRERLAREYAAILFKEYALQDAGTLDGTQMGLASRACGEFPLSDQEILVRHFHKEVGERVEAYARAQASHDSRGGGR